MGASLKSNKDRRIVDAICNLLPMGNHQSRSVKIHIVACCTDSEAGGRGRGRRSSLQPRLERQQSLIIMTLHKLRFNVNKETNIIISQLDSTASHSSLPAPPPSFLSYPTSLACVSRPLHLLARCQSASANVENYLRLPKDISCGCFFMPHATCRCRNLMEIYVESMLRLLSCHHHWHRLKVHSTYPLPPCLGRGLLAWPAS